MLIEGRAFMVCFQILSFYAYISGCKLIDISPCVYIGHKRVVLLHDLSVAVL